MGSRSAEPPFDWQQPATWKRAVAGIDAAYLSYYPDLAAPGATQCISEFCELAVSSGVRRIVLLSGRGETEAERCEEIVMQCGAAWTIVRASWFSQHFSESYLLELILDGVAVLHSAHWAADRDSETAERVSMQG